jgi:hypothetical protein
MAPRKFSKKLVPEPPAPESEQSESDNEAEPEEEGDEESETDNEEEEGPSASSTHMARKPQSMSKRAGLTFPPTRAVNYLKQGRYAERISKSTYLSLQVDFIP